MVGGGRAGLAGSLSTALIGQALPLAAPSAPGTRRSVSDDPCRQPRLGRLGEWKVPTPGTPVVRRSISRVGQRREDV